jgi:hypothetical protein
MKICTNAKSSLLLLIASLFLFSCGTSRFSQSVLDSREKDKKAFVETTDGKITEANEAKIKSPLFGKSTIELDGEVKIPTKEVVAYQNSTGYYRRVNGQFAPRFKKGLINMYSVTENYTEWEQSSAPGGGSRMRNRVRIIYYMQKGDQSPVQRFSPNLTRDFVKDYAPAMEFMNVYDETQKKVKMWSWINTGAVIGGAILAATSYNSNTDQVNKPLGYTGLALLGGGLVNGVVNKIRKGKNSKNLELAIDTYNSQVARKKKK